MSQIIKYDVIYVLIAVIFVFTYLIFENVCIDKNYSISIIPTDKIRIIDVLMALVMFFFSAFRYRVGTDYETYFERYNWYNLEWGRISKYIDNEKLFVYLCRAAGIITRNKFGIFWACAFILYPFLVIFARKYTKHPAYVIMCYVFLEFYGLSNNILRQAIAMQLVMFSSILWANQKKMTSFILAIFSVGFHSTAIIGLFLIVISRFIKPKITYLGISTFLGFCMMFAWRIIGTIIPYIPYVNKYAKYFHKSGQVYTSLGMYAYIFFYICLCIILIRYRGNAEKGIIDLNFYDSCISKIIISIPFFFIATQWSYANRIGVYVFQFIIFALPNIFFIKLKNGDIEKVLIVLMLIIWLLFSNIFSFDNTYWQYSFQFNRW